MATQASDTANNTASRRARGASPDDLTVIAQRAQAFTNASGVAIALSEGNADEIICRARSGASAPDVGAALRVEGTFTGLCIQSGKELRCDDCETDTRVDTAAIRALNIRSMVVTPIREESRVIGVLAVFAPTPHAFTITHVAVLKTMADQISVLLQKERRPRAEGQHIEAPLPPAPIAVKPVAAAPVTPPAVVIKPAPAPPRAPAPVVAKVEPVRQSAPLEVVPLAMPTKKEERRVEPQPRASFGTFDSAAEDRPSGSRFMLLGVVAVLLVAAAGTFALLKMRKPSAPAQPTQQTANVPAAQISAAPANSQPATQPNSSASLANPAVVVAASPANASAKAASETGNAKKSAKNSDKTSSSEERETPAEKPTVVATINSGGPSRIQQSASAPSADVAPSFGIANDNTAALPSLTRAVPTSTPSAAVQQSQLEPLKLIKTVAPSYPPIAKARHMSGTVVVEVKVGKDGKVSNPKFISGPPIFKDAAFDAVTQYRFKAAILNGVPVEQTTQIRLDFRDRE
ncbi:MAG TPA: TonB family protein [Candidatus Angelobacter sp.]|nr:TonB family protein [Candidatus Angelobacter sp.]